MPNFLQIGRTVAEIWPFTIFQDGGRPPFWIFKKFKILTALALRGAKVHHLAKFCANRSRRCGDMAVFDFSRWRRTAGADPGVQFGGGHMASAEREPIMGV